MTEHAEYVSPGHPDRLADAIASAKLDPRRLLGYVEVHIEQGPVLEQKNLAVGLVAAIAGQSRMRVRFLGQAGHAGTVPMNLRHDALCAAAEFVLAVESFARQVADLVATVGELTVSPGAPMSAVAPSRERPIDQPNASSTVNPDGAKAGVCSVQRAPLRRYIRRAEPSPEPPMSNPGTPTSTTAPSPEMATLRQIVASMQGAAKRAGVRIDRKSTRLNSSHRT